MISLASLNRFSPNGQDSWLQAMADLAPSLIQHNDMNLLEWQHFCAQWGHETNGMALSGMRENMRFTSSRRILEVYSYRLGVALQRDAGLRETYRTRERLAAALVGNSDLLADIVYGGREGTPWMQGSKYIGRGPTQITHLDNYRAIMAEIRRQPGGEACPDLVEQPRQLERPEWGVRSAFADWKIKGLGRYARRDAVDAVSAALNTGSAQKIASTNGLPSRRRWLAKAKVVWPRFDSEAPEVSPAEPAEVSGIRPGDSGDHVAELQRLLHEKGYPCGATDGTYGTLSQRAVVSLQHEHGLPPTGIVDDATMAALKDTAAADLGERAKLTPDELAARGSTTVPAAKAVGWKARVLGWLGLGGAGTTIASPGWLETAAGFLERGAGPLKNLLGVAGNLVTPQTLAVAGFGLLAFFGWRLTKVAEAIIAARVAAAQSGANLER